MTAKTRPSLSDEQAIHPFHLTMIKKLLVASDSALIGAVLDRLGSAQAQVFLDQVRNWASQYNNKPHKESRRTERRRGGIGTHPFA